MSEERLVTFEQSGPITVGAIHAASVLDAINVSQFGEEVLDYVEHHSGVNLLLDFQRVNYLSSAVLTELIKIDHACKGVGGTLRLCSLNRDIRNIFEITNLDKHFIIYESVAVGIKRHIRSLDVQAEEDGWGQVGRDT